MKRVNISTGSKWEKKYGYSRAVRVGNLIFSSGTVAVDETGNLVGKGNEYEQTLFAFQKIEGSLKRIGAGKEDIVRSRIYMVNIDRIDEAGRANRDFFENIAPCLTAIEISRLENPEFLVEVEIEAVVGK